MVRNEETLLESGNDFQLGEAARPAIVLTR
jgi:hypothetical protein